MRTTRWINMSQPQMLVTAQIFLYMRAFFALLSFNILSPISIVGGVAGAYGLANERKWGFYVAAGVALVQMALTVLIMIAGTMHFYMVLNLLFDFVLVGSVLHPKTRDYVRIWFK